MQNCNALCIVLQNLPLLARTGNSTGINLRDLRKKDDLRNPISNIYVLELFVGIKSCELYILRNFMGIN